MNNNYLIYNIYRTLYTFTALIKKAKQLRNIIKTLQWTYTTDNTRMAQLYMKYWQSQLLT